jgi:phosphoribosylanthranilate isomerase
MGAGYGGTGKKFNWEMLKDATVGKPFFLSGGIEPGDEERLHEFSREPVGRALFAIDINSRFEVTPGVKDMNKVKEFADRMKNTG